MTVAALYVEAGGAYFGLPDVDPWDEARDARLYAGPWPVVAHPPCKAWSVMGQCRPEIARGDDDGCFLAALGAVTRWGGVLEHPAQHVNDPDRAAGGSREHQPGRLVFAGRRPDTGCTPGGAP